MKDYSFFNQPIIIALIGLGIFIFLVFWRRKRIKKRKIAIQNAQNQIPTIIKEFSLGLEMMSKNTEEIITRDFIILHIEAFEQIEKAEKLFFDVSNPLKRSEDYVLGIGKENMIKIIDIVEKIVKNFNSYIVLLNNKKNESLSQESEELFTKIAVMLELNGLTLNLLIFKLSNTSNYMSYSEIPMYKWMNTFKTPEI